MRRLALAAGVALAVSAAMSAGATASGAEKVMVQVMTIRASGDPKGAAPTFDAELAALRAMLGAAYGGYGRYEYVELLTRRSSLKAPVDFALKPGPTVSITVEEFKNGRFTAVVEMFRDGKRVGKTKIMGREGVYSFVALSSDPRKKELIVVAFKVTTAR